MAAISSRCVVGSKFVLDVALTTPAAILKLRLAKEDFARFRDKSNFYRLPYSTSIETFFKPSVQY
jgi:hypothetical protein